MTNRVNYKCSAFPCHKENKLQDCTFCYCPMYPCANDEIGQNGKWIKSGDGKDILDCSNCTWPHDRKRVNELFRFLKKEWKG